MRSIVRTPRLRLVTVTLLLGSVLSAPATADTVDSRLYVRWALLIGDVDTRQDLGPGVGDEEAEDLLNHWDYERDNEELMRIFGLQTIDTLTRGISRIAAEGGAVSSSTLVGESEIQIRVKIRPHDDLAPQPGVVCAVEVSRDDEPISYPTVVSPYGERVIVSSRTAGTNEPGEPTPLLWLVLQVDRVDSSVTQPEA